MKKLIALMLVLVLTLGMAACGNDTQSEETTEQTEQTEQTVTDTEDAQDEPAQGDIEGTDDVILEEGNENEQTEETDGEETEETVDMENLPEADTTNDLPIMTPDGGFLDTDGNPISDTDSMAVTMLKDLWSLFAEEEKFPIAGGNPEAGVMDAPGAYDLAYAEGLSAQLLIPADQIGNITEAGTMIHMMNANNFTGGIVRLADGVDTAAFAQAMRDAIQNNQWMCGFPEKLIVADMIGGYVLIAFGVNDAMTPLQTHLTQGFPGAKILFDEAITG